jgi:CMP-N,N'-diacetyllegionaminic acid synthase
MSLTIALIPAKRHSVGVASKNWRPITSDGFHCVDLAVQVAKAALDPDDIRETVSFVWTDQPVALTTCAYGAVAHERSKGLPDTMLAVVQDFLATVPGPDDEIIVLLQPSSPLRTAETVRKAIQMLVENPKADSVVSVSPSYPIDWLISVNHRGYLYRSASDCPSNEPLGAMGSRRQDCAVTYKRDGVVYAFRRSTVTKYGDIYGSNCLPLYTPPEEALSIDTPADWDEAVRRLQARASVQA